MSTVKRKVFAYITHRDRLLVFSHPLAPDAGIQVPAGTVRDGERLEDAVMREAAEETGLTGLVLVRYLGEQRRHMADFGWEEVHYRFFYHLRCTIEPPERWRNHEPDPAGGGELPLFDLFWARLPHGVPKLIAGHDVFLPRLIDYLTADGLLCDCMHPRPAK